MHNWRKMITCTHIKQNIHLSSVWVDYAVSIVCNISRVGAVDIKIVGSAVVSLRWLLSKYWLCLRVIIRVEVLQLKVWPSAVDKFVWLYEEWWCIWFVRHESMHKIILLPQWLSLNAKITRFKALDTVCCWCEYLLLKCWCNLVQKHSSLSIVTCMCTHYIFLMQCW